MRFAFKAWLQAYGPSVVIFLGGFLAAVGGFWSALKLKENSPRREKLFAGALILAGTLISLVGSVWADLQRHDFERELKQQSGKVSFLSGELVKKTDALAQKSDQIARLNAQIASSVTGGDSFCYMQFSILKGSETAVVAFVHQGRFPLYDVAVRIVDLDKWERLGTTWENMLRSQTQIDLGNLSYGQAAWRGSWPLPNSDRQRYNVFFGARNGFWTQLIRLRRVHGQWTSAIKVTRESKGRTRVLLEKVDKDFPRSARGSVEWD